MKKVTKFLLKLLHAVVHFVSFVFILKVIIFILVSSIVVWILVLAQFPDNTKIVDGVNLAMSKLPYTLAIATVGIIYFMIYKAVKEIRLEKRLKRLEEKIS